MSSQSNSGTFPSSQKVHSCLTAVHPCSHSSPRLPLTRSCVCNFAFLDISFKCSDAPCHLHVAFSLSVLFLRFTHVIACTSSFLVTAELYPIKWIYHILFMHSPVRGVCSASGRLGTTLLWTFTHAGLCGHVFISLGSFLVESLARTVNLWLTFTETA